MAPTPTIGAMGGRAAVPHTDQRGTAQSTSIASSQLVLSRKCADMASVVPGAIAGEGAIGAGSALRRRRWRTSYHPGQAAMMEEGLREALVFSWLSRCPSYRLGRRGGAGLFV